MKEPRVYLEDILDCIHRIEDYTSGLDEDGFIGSQQIQDAVLRRLEIMGEAVKHLPIGIRNENPDVPWRSIAGLRDFLIHAYSRVNPHRVWAVIENDLPGLDDKIEKIIESVD